LQERSGARLDYWRTAALLTLALVAKPMIVTLPFVLLLLDYWPLRRMRIGSESRASDTKAENIEPITFAGLIIEKIPLFALAALSSLVTILAQRSSGAMTYLEGVSFSVRIQNAAVSYVRYLGMSIWPSNLSVIYPHPNGPGGTPWTALEVAGATTVLIAITLFVVWQRNRRYLIVGWLWFLGTLVPVIGLIQVGTQAMADRYMYFSIVGLTIAFAWSIRDLVRARLEAGGLDLPWLRAFVTLSAAGILVAFTWTAHSQSRHWENSVTLFSHSNKLYPGDPFILNHLGFAHLSRHEHEDATIQFRRALLYPPENHKTHSGLGRSLHAQGKIDEAITHYRAALAINRDYVEALGNLGIALSQREQVSEANQMFRRAMEIEPDSPMHLANYASSLMQLGRSDEAIKTYSEALTRDPSSAWIRTQLGLAILSQGDSEGAIEQFERALVDEPGFAKAQAGLEAARVDRRTNRSFSAPE
jgi:Flp pilus assembly protein TadD